MENKNNVSRILEGVVSDIEDGRLEHLDICYALIDEAERDYGQQFVEPYKTRLESIM